MMLYTFYQTGKHLFCQAFPCLANTLRYFWWSRNCTWCPTRTIDRNTAATATATTASRSY